MEGVRGGEVAVGGGDPGEARCFLHGAFLPSEEEWDFLWCDVSWLRENFDHAYMEEHVRICHFRNHYEVRTPQRWSETRRV